VFCCLQVVATCKHFLGYGVEGAEGHSRCGRPWLQPYGQL
jgi:beta-glucosidase-like glycosyl hydrolase